MSDLREAAQQAMEQKRYVITGNEFHGAPPKPYANWGDAIATMLDSRVIQGLRISALERQEMDDKEAAAFRAGATAMFDALLYRVANNWHPASQAECDAQNDWATEWATDALDEVSPESCAKWKSIQQAWADGYNLGMGRAAPERPATRGGER